MCCVVCCVLWVLWLVCVGVVVVFCNVRFVLNIGLCVIDSLMLMCDDVCICWCVCVMDVDVWGFVCDIWVCIVWWWCVCGGWWWWWCDLMVDFDFWNFKLMCVKIWEMCGCEWWGWIVWWWWWVMWWWNVWWWCVDGLIGLRWRILSCIRESIRLDFLNFLRASWGRTGAGSWILWMWYCLCLGCEVYSWEGWCLRIWFIWWIWWMWVRIDEAFGWRWRTNRRMSERFCFRELLRWVGWCIMRLIINDWCWRSIMNDWSCMGFWLRCEIFWCIRAISRRWRRKCWRSWRRWLNKFLVWMSMWRCIWWMSGWSNVLRMKYIWVLLKRSFWWCRRSRCVSKRKRRRSIWRFKNAWIRWRLKVFCLSFIILMLI